MESLFLRQGAGCSGYISFAHLVALLFEENQCIMLRKSEIIVKLRCGSANRPHQKCDGISFNFSCLGLQTFSRHCHLASIKLILIMNSQAHSSVPSYFDSTLRYSLQSSSRK